MRRARSVEPEASPRSLTQTGVLISEVPIVLPPHPHFFKDEILLSRVMFQGKRREPAYCVEHLLAVLIESYEDAVTPTNLAVLLWST